MPRSRLIRSLSSIPAESRFLNKKKGLGVSSVKTYKISGEIRKRGEKLPFHKEIKAVKKEDALQMLYSDLGSRHKARRFEINILNVEELVEEVREA